jgi:predicted N-acetyltransferase YhbS
MKFTVREETPQEQPAVREVLLEAFGQPDEADLVDALRRGSAFIPELSLVGVAGDAVVGQILFTRLHVRGEQRWPGLALAPMAVRRAFQKLGIGGELVRAGLAIARRRDEPFVVVLGHPTYYPRFGFKRASGWGIRATIEVPDDALLALELRKGGLAGVSGIVEWAPEFGIGG